MVHLKHFWSICSNYIICNILYWNEVIIVTHKSLNFDLLKFFVLIVINTYLCCKNELVIGVFMSVIASSFSSITPEIFVRSISQAYSRYGNKKDLWRIRPTAEKMNFSNMNVAYDAQKLIRVNNLLLQADSMES